jgi:hypothetical protein
MQLRTSLLFSIAKELKWIADIYKVCVVVVNQVTAAFENELTTTNNNNNNNSYSNCNNCNNNKIIPALGLAWSHCVNTRFMLTRDSDNIRFSYNQEFNYDKNNRNNSDYNTTTDNSSTLNDNKENLKPVFNRNVNNNGLVSGGSELNNNINNNYNNNNNINNNNFNVNNEQIKLKKNVKMDINVFPHYIKYLNYGDNESKINYENKNMAMKSTRYIKIEFSPIRDNLSCFFEILNSGVKGI